MELWDCHEHKDELLVSDAATVYHPKRGQLCYMEQHWDCFLWHPIKFSDRSKAYRWIRQGSIAEIQEGIMCLAVGFSTKAFEARQD